MNKLSRSLKFCSSGSTEVTNFAMPDVVANFRPLRRLSATQKFYQQYNLVPSFPIQNNRNSRH